MAEVLLPRLIELRRGQSETTTLSSQTFPNEFLTADDSLKILFMTKICIFIELRVTYTPRAFSTAMLFNSFMRGSPTGDIIEHPQTLG